LNPRGRQQALCGGARRGIASSCAGEQDLGLRCDRWSTGHTIKRRALENRHKLSGRRFTAALQPQRRTAATGVESIDSLISR
jgi:hypothetical protein